MFAPGIPKKDNMAKLPVIKKPYETNYCIQHHNADRAGEHYDVRIHIPTIGALSWAGRKLPKTGESVYMKEQPVHCFIKGTKVKMKEGFKNIEDINIGDEVQSLNNNKIEFKKVTNKWVGKTTKLIDFVFNDIKKATKVTCTPSHKIYTDKGKIEAINLLDHKLLVQKRKLSNDQKQMLMGMLLGDGNISPRKDTIRICHGPKQKVYSEYINEQLKNISLRFYTEGENTWNILACDNREWRDYLYTPKKRITYEWLEKMGERGLAFYFLDDGSYSLAHSHFIEFATMGFDRNDINIFCSWLFNKYQIKTAIYIARHDTRFNKLPPTNRELLRVRISDLESIKKFFFLIGPYLPIFSKDIKKTPRKHKQHKCKNCNFIIDMRRKYCGLCLWNDAKNSTPNKYKGLVYSHAIYHRFKSWPNGNYPGEKSEQDWIDDFYKILGTKAECEKITCNLEYKSLNHPIKIRNVNNIEVYDIEVEDNHNYILKSGLIVSNSANYMDFQGILPHGYGKGTVKLHDRDRIEILNSRPGHISWNLYKSTGPIEYTLHEIAPQLWRMTNRTQTKEKNIDLTQAKPKYKDLQDPNKVLDLGENYVLQEKIDGASTLIHLKKKGDPIRLFSLREPKKGDTGLIEYTHKVPSVMNARTDDDTEGTILRGEVYAIDPTTGKATHPAIIGGLLNSNVWKSRDKQKQHGELKTAIYDVIKYNGKDVEHLPYIEKLELLSSIKQKYPDVFTLPKMAFDDEAKRQLFHSIRLEKNDTTKEGLVAHNLYEKEQPIKAKFDTEHDVIIREIFPAGEGKYKDKAAGGYYYSHTEDGPIAGKIGTGFSDVERIDMLKRPEKYKGMIAKVRASELNRSGALQKPSHIMMHQEKNSPERLKEINPI